MNQRQCLRHEMSQPVEDGNGEFRVEALRRQNGVEVGHPGYFEKLSTHVRRDGGPGLNVLVRIWLWPAPMRSASGSTLSPQMFLDVVREE